MTSVISTLTTCGLLKDTMKLDGFGRPTNWELVKILCKPERPALRFHSRLDELCHVNST